MISNLAELLLIVLASFGLSIGIFGTIYLIASSKRIKKYKEELNKENK